MGMKDEYWRKVMAQYQASGKNAKTFSREHGIAASTLQYWVGKTKREEASGRFARVETGERIELELSSGVRIRVNRGDLRNVLEALCER